MEMDRKRVLMNLKGYDGWEHTNYKLVKAGADVIIEALEKDEERQVMFSKNVRAILECNFAGFKDEIIDVAVDRIMSLGMEGE